MLRRAVSSNGENAGEWCYLLPGSVLKHVSESTTRTLKETTKKKVSITLLKRTEGVIQGNYHQLNVG